jgi:transposase
LIGDKAYDSDRLDRDLAESYGIEMIAPHRGERRTPTQDGRPLRRYRRRWRVERLFAWLHHFGRLVIRWEYHVENFFGMVRLGCMQILLGRRVPRTYLSLCVHAKSGVSCFLQDRKQLGQQHHNPPVMACVSIAEFFPEENSLKMCRSCSESADTGAGTNVRSRSTSIHSLMADSLNCRDAPWQQGANLCC